MFRPQELACCVPALVRAAEDALARWRARPPDAVHAIDDDMTRATFDVVAATLLPSADEKFAATVQDSVRSLQRFGAWGILYAPMNLPQGVPYPGMVAH